MRAARLNLPRFHITQYGRTVLGAEPAHPLDPDRYLARIEDRVAERLDSRLIAGSAIRRMCTSWAAICVCVLLVAPAPSDGDAPLELVSPVRLGLEFAADGNCRRPRGGGDAGFVGTVVPLLALGPRESQLSLDGGVGVGVLARHEFGEQDFGGPIQIVVTFGLRIPVSRTLAIGYRMQHISDARIYGDKGNGADLHMLELTYTFR